MKSEWSGRQHISSPLHWQNIGIFLTAKNIFWHWRKQHLNPNTIRHVAESSCIRLEKHLAVKRTISESTGGFSRRCNGYCIGWRIDLIYESQDMEYNAHNSKLYCVRAKLIILLAEGERCSVLRGSLSLSSSAGSRWHRALRGIRLLDIDTKSSSLDVNDDVSSVEERLGQSIERTCMLHVGRTSGEWLLL